VLMLFKLVMKPNYFGALACSSTFEFARAVNYILLKQNLTIKQCVCDWQQIATHFELDTTQGKACFCALVAAGGSWRWSWTKGWFHKSNVKSLLQVEIYLQQSNFFDVVTNTACDNMPGFKKESEFVASVTFHAKTLPGTL